MSGFCLQNQKMASSAVEEVRVPRIKLGSQGFEVSAQGLGCMGMSAFYGPPKPEPDMINLIHYAASRGITHLDTSDVYGPHTNELLLGKVLLLFIILSTVFNLYNDHDSPSIGPLESGFA